MASDLGEVSMHEALISIKPTYVRRFLTGEKFVEIRSRAVNLTPGSRLWIYSTLPKGCIEAVAEVNRVVFGTPSDIWHRYSRSLAVSRTNYLKYVNGASRVSAIIINRVIRMPIEVNLSMLRKMIPSFHPPQFLKYMSETDPLYVGIMDLLFAQAGEEYMNSMGLTKKCAANICRIKLNN